MDNFLSEDYYQPKNEQEDNFLVDSDGNQIQIKRRDTRLINHLDSPRNSNLSVIYERVSTPEASADTQVKETSGIGFESSASVQNDTIHEREENSKPQSIEQLEQDFESAIEKPKDDVSNDSMKAAASQSDTKLRPVSR